MGSHWTGCLAARWVSGLPGAEARLEGGVFQASGASAVAVGLAAVAPGPDAGSSSGQDAFLRPARLVTDSSSW